MRASLFDPDNKSAPLDFPVISTGIIPIDVTVNFVNGITWFRRSDPLILDLDGDGIELSASSSAVLFDHNADGLKTGTQWAKADDGILVRDLNGNGSIDSGREHFGDQTQITTTNALGQSVTTLATNGFAALNALDKDAAGVSDGVFDASDVAYADLKVWRDLNQDGISQSNELLGLAESGVTAIQLTQTPTQAAQGKSTFTKTVAGVDDQGQPVSISTSQTVQNVNYTQNAFYREYTDNPAITTQAAALPQIQGAGQVRDLREAMSLVDANGQATTPAATLTQQVSAFGNADTAEQRQGLLPSLITTWGATSSLAEAKVRTPDTGTGFLGSDGSIGGGNAGGGGASTYFPIGRGIANFAAAEPAYYAKLTVLERFNGQAILERYARQVSGQYFHQPTQQWRSYIAYTVVIETPRRAFFDQAYDSLTTSVYQSLYLQTAGKALLDQVELTVDDKGLRLDFAALNASLVAQAQADPANAAVNLAEFIHFAGDSLAGSGWDGAAQLADLLEAHSLTAEQIGAMNYLGFKFAGEMGSTADTNRVGTGLADGLIGRGGNDTLNGAGGNDVLIGGAGNDVLYGGQGNDQMVGGSGQDYLNGQWGDDTYVWGPGQGNDTVDDLYANAGGSNKVVLRGLNPQDVRSEFLGVDDYRGIQLTIVSTGETLVVRNSAYLAWYGQSFHAPVNFLFADGTVWDMEEAMRQTVPMPTAGDDVIMGTHLDDRADRLNGGVGNDTIYGGDGNDVLEGGAGDDVLYGRAAWDARDTYYPDANARRRAASNTDVYVFGRGDGNDIVINADRGVLDVDIIRFKEGVAAVDIEVRQQGRNLVLNIIGTTDSITVERYFEDRRSQAWMVNGRSTQGGIERFEFADGVVWSKAEVDVMALVGSAQDDAISGNASNNVLIGGLGIDLLQGGMGHETLQGDEGNDSLDGGIGNDLLLGGEGNDALEGGRGDDTLDGGSGNDVLFAGDGADTVRFGRGDGQDVLKRDIDFYVTYYSGWNGYGIVNPGGNNAVELKGDIAPADVTLRRVGTTLELSIKGTEDVLKVESFYVNQGTDPLDMNFSLREIRFADGTVWGPQQMLAQMLVGDGSNEVLLGFGSDEVLDGQGGNDTLNGAGGNNTYRFGLGDGVDRVVFSDYSAQGTLAFKDGVAPQDVQVRRVGNNAVFTIVGTGDAITFDYAFPGYVSNGTALQFVAGVTFADGTVWTAAQVDQMAMQGTAGDDVIRDVPSTSETLLAGGAGNDLLIGERGDTVYEFNLGDGDDTLDEAGSAYTIDTLRFGVGIVATDLNVSKLGKDLVIGINGTDDQVTIRNHSGTVIENFEVGGITLTYAQVAGLLDVDGFENLFGTAGDDILNGTGKVSTITGFGGNDQLFGNDGDDVLEGGLDDDSLDGGAGQDQLNGGAGNDILKGGAGRDQMTGGAGANTYVFNRGDQLDTLTLTPSATEVIALGVGIAPGQLTVQLGQQLTWDGTQYVRQIVIGFGGNDAITLAVAYDVFGQGGISPLEGLHFADGTTWSFSDLMAHVDNGIAGAQTYFREDDLHAIGSQGDDYIYTTGSPNAYLEGRDNDDYLTGRGTNALMDGGNGHDVLNVANRAGLVLVGNLGNDEIFTPFASGENGDANTISFNAGDGADRLTGYSASASVLSLGVGIEPEDVVFQIDAEGDLVISFAGQPGDSIRMGWIDPLSGVARFSPAVDKLQFIGADGAVRLYDLVRPDNGFDNPVMVHRPEPSPIFGGEAALAYAQTGNLKGAVYIAANNDPLGNKTLFGTFGDDTLTGGGGNDVLAALDGNDLLLGADGNDILMGGAGDDVLDAGTGNNKSYGGAGGDTYLYTRGNGSLLIEDGQFADGGEGGYGGFVGYGGDINQLVFGEGVVLEDLTFSQDGTHLKVVVGGANASSGDEILLGGFDPFLASANQSIQSFIFQSGQTVTLDGLWGEGSTSFLVNDGDGSGDVVGAGLRDELRGDQGANLLDGNGGNDRLVGGSGSDAYLVREGSGHDVIVDSSEDINTVVFDSTDLTAGAVWLEVQGGVSIVHFAGGSITLDGWDGQDPSTAPVANFVFADGSVLSMAELWDRPRDHVGTTGADLLIGTSNDDRMEGLLGDDQMQGGAGADTYVIEADSGTDTITDLSALGQENTLLINNGMLAQDIRLSVNADRQLVVVLGGGNQVALADIDVDVSLLTHSIDFFSFDNGNGITLTYQELLAQGFEILGTDQSDQLKGTGIFDRIDAGAGDDLILATQGGDLLLGGDGNDTFEYRLGDGNVTIVDVADATGGNVIRFGAGITPDLIERKLRFVVNEQNPAANVFSIVFDENNSITLQGFDPTDPENSPHAASFFEFSDGTVLSWAEMLDKVFVVEGDFDSNELAGTSRSDRLYGYQGDDWLAAGDGEDVLTGSVGDDVLEGGGGADNYVFSLGDGADTLLDGSLQNNTLTFGEGIIREDISAVRDGADWIVSYGSLGDTVRILSNDGINPPSEVITNIALSDGSLFAFSELTNLAPEVGVPLENQFVHIGVPISFDFSLDAFIDPDGTPMTFAVEMENGEPLPSWLTFDPQTRAFAGTPQAGSQGAYTVVVYAVDSVGAAISQSFTLEVVNEAPVAQNDFAAIAEDAVGGQTVIGNVLANDGDADVGDILSVLTPAVFAGIYGELTLAADGSYTYVLNNSSSEVQSLLGGEVVEDVFSYEATDGLGASEGVLTITIIGAADAPVVATAIASQTARERQVISFTVPTTTFSASGALTLIAQKVDDLGSLVGLPSWLVFNAATGVFSGTPGSSDGGSFNFSVTAMDTAGNSASSQFTLNIFDEFAGVGVNQAVVTGGTGGRVLNGTNLSEVIYGQSGNDKVVAGAGNDTITGGTGSDVLEGGAGDDAFLLNGSDVGYDLYNGGDGYDQVNGGSGDDTIRVYNFSGQNTVEKIDGGQGVNVIAGTIYGDTINLSATDVLNIANIDGGAGIDVITGSAGNDTIIGGTGSDTLAGGLGDDVFQVAGTDGGYDLYNGGDGYDQVNGGSGDDTIRVYNFSGQNTVEKIDGGQGVNVIAGTIYGDTINLSATDVLNIANIDGGAGTDVITGSAGNDTIIGGTGSDTLAGGLGDDTYRLARGDGVDSITENDATASNTDVALFDAGIAMDQLWFRRVSNTLEVSIIGTSDKINIANWYLGDQYRVEQFKTSDGKTLLDSQVQNLVSAMAAFAPPAAGETMLPANYAAALQPVIAANWV